MADKFTDEEVIKALKCCLNSRHLMSCQECCFHGKSVNCVYWLEYNALDLINRQKAEIERLTTLAELGQMRANDYRAMRDKAKTAKAEAIKEFAERLKQTAYTHSTITGYQYPVVDVAEIDELVREMTEEKT